SWCRWGDEGGGVRCDVAAVPHGGEDAIAVVDLWCGDDVGGCGDGGGPQGHSNPWQLRFTDQNSNYFCAFLLGRLKSVSPVPPAGQANPPDVVTTHQAWVKAKKEIDGLMLMTIDPDIQKNLEHLGAYDILKELKTLYVQQEDQELLQTKKSYKAAKGNQGKGKAKMGYALVQAPSFAPNPKNPPTPKKDNPTKDETYHQCGEVELYSFPSTSWVYDTGYGTYICITTQGLGGSRKIKPGALSLNKRTKLNLDPALLWHCRLGHINKKRIEKLQQDGLLDSTDIKSFEKCVACMSEKMARKPYSHQVERAKDLLGLIHTDEAKNQLGKTIKSLRSDRGGYRKETMGYSFYYLPENKVFVTRNAEFFENDVIDHEASRSLEDLEIIQKEDTHPSLDTSLNHEEFDQEIDEPQSNINPIRRSTRTCLPTDRLCLYIDVEEHELGDLDNKVWELIDLPPDGKTIGHTWLFKKKTDMDGDVHTYKARLVAKGFIQTPEIDYEETFSLVANIRAIRILIAITAFYDYEIWQMDVKTAFLNGYLNEEVYMEQPEGFVNQKFLNQVCKLKHSIYGLKKTSRKCNKRFDDEIKKFGFSQNHDEPCVYVKVSGSYVTFLIIYVDSILIMGNNISMLQNVKSYLGRCFAMKDLEEAAYILGIKIYQDRSKRLIGLCQSAYIEKILKRYYMENSKRETISMQEKLKFSKSQGASTPSEIQCMKNIPYTLAIRSIMYVVRCTRSDVAFTQNITSRFQQNPGDAHWTAVKNILKYLRNTKDMFLVYGGDTKRELMVSCYTDAGYLTDADDIKSQTGYVFVLNGGAVDWKSTKQSIFTTSSINAEYIAAFDASKEAVWICKIISGLGVVFTIEEPINMYCDNTRAIEIAKDHGVTKGAIHFRVKVHYL
nr:retrotransposon protein, putative, Ty1-copia subclass [Tanacetum cinerariifolium]